MKMILVFPAQAGVILALPGRLAMDVGFPRASGGDPVPAYLFDLGVQFSPRKRG